MLDREMRAVVVARVGRLMAQQTHLLVDEVELRDGGRRMDMLLVNGHLTAFELKSDADTLRRLPGQATAYGLVADRAVLVCGARHLGTAAATVPEWWEIWQVVERGGRPTAVTVREGHVNRLVSPRALTSLLLRDELADELYWLGVGRMSRASVDALRDRLSAAVPLAELRRRVRQRLLRRGAWLDRAVSYNPPAAAPLVRPVPVEASVG